MPPGKRCETAPPGLDPHISLTIRKMRLIDVCQSAVVVAHLEDTALLHSALIAEGFSTLEVRGPYTSLQLGYSADMRCLVNHANAWRIVASMQGPAIVVEADFVPVRGMGELPWPGAPTTQGNGLIYLYACGPEFWDLCQPAVARGHAGGAVALLMFPETAQLLLRFAEGVIADNQAGSYCAWDSRLGYWLLERGVQSYLPYRHYGEHGGIPNPEHSRHGLGRPHQADALMGPLAFLPAYARGSRWRLIRSRMRARWWGIIRLAAGRVVGARDWRRSEKWALARFALGRLVTRRVPRA